MALGNDQCASCGDNADSVTAEKYGQYVSDAVARIKSSVPRVIVNLRKCFPWQLLSYTLYLPHTDYMCLIQLVCSRSHLCIQSALASRIAVPKETTVRPSSTDKSAHASKAQTRIVQIWINLQRVSVQTRCSVCLALDTYENCYLIAAYNEQLVNIYNSYKNEPSDTFAVAYQPANIDINTFPIDALRWVNLTAYPIAFC